MNVERWMNDKPNDLTDGRSEGLDVSPTPYKQTTTSSARASSYPNLRSGSGVVSAMA